MISDEVQQIKLHFFLQLQFNYIFQQRPIKGVK